MKIPRQDAFRLMWDALKNVLPLLEVQARRARNVASRKVAIRLLHQVREALQAAEDSECS